MKLALFRAAVLLAALAYIAAAAVQLAGQRALGNFSPGGIERGLRWNAGNDQLWGEHGRRLLSSADPSQTAPAIDALQRAARLNPLEPDNWDRLATAYQMMGDNNRAGVVLHNALVAVPHSPEAAWRFANFLVLQGRVREAAPYLRVVAANARPMRMAAYDLASKILTDVGAVFRDVVPTDPLSRADYLDFLWFRGKLVEGYPVWESLRGSGQLAIDKGNAYVDRLAAMGLGSEAERVWEELLQDTGRRETKPPGDAVTNGDFETNITNAGLDWRLTPGAGYDIDFDNLELQNGSRSLRVTFDGSQNPDFLGVWQLAAVTPGAHYRFSGYMKTANITTTNGLAFCQSAYGQGADGSMNRCTPELTGSENWKRQELEFTVPANTRVVRIELRRLQSTKLNNRLAGRVWIDNVSLRQVD